MTKISLISLMCISSLCFSQSKTNRTAQKLMGGWTLEAFEEAYKIGDSLVLRKIGTVEPTKFEFKEHDTLVVVYNSGKSEKYLWKMRKKSVEISLLTKTDFSAKIIGDFELTFWNDDKELFMEIKGKPHNGIKIKR